MRLLKYGMIVVLRIQRVPRRPRKCESKLRHRLVAKLSVHMDSLSCIPVPSDSNDFTDFECSDGFLAVINFGRGGDFAFYASDESVYDVTDAETI
jgi:hypothetical protein